MHDTGEAGLGQAVTPRPGGCSASQLIDAYRRALRLRHELAQAGGNREIATAITALDAVSLALAGAAMTAVEREATGERAARAADRR